VNVAGQELTPVIQKRGESFECIILEGERDWVEFLNPLGVYLHGGFRARNGKWAPHSFSFKLRRDLLLKERTGDDAEVTKGALGDVFCLVKTYIHDTKLMQDPLLVLPEAFLSRVKGHYPQDLLAEKAVPKLVKENYQKLAELLLRPVSLYPKAAEYMQWLCKDHTGNRVRVSSLAWLRRQGSGSKAIGFLGGH
jgi:hypothetical protein